ncbi:unnamed protein product [Wuchereria bancrofti]|uniref:Uncharacterized protein n=1 Tax=Wuchereria bancrofti TaxID=6293 RepID=A0A3P7DY20_WUCBA|nr:unnamed protein product [Wuchereria bancrofti]
MRVVGDAIDFGRGQHNLGCTPRGFGHNRHMAHHTGRMSLRAQIALQSVVTYSEHAGSRVKSVAARKRAETQAILAYALRPVEKRA